ncbi:MAG: hypothetical protein QNK37_35575 [Acidobacteriota bacterium]|nr:hypothetical protein [Acidobacteriota bacterium]
MLTIGRMNLTLPAGFERRAPTIVRLVADRLADARLPQSQNLDRLSLPPLTLHSGMDDHGVAGAVADAILSRLRKETP